MYKKIISLLIILLILIIFLPKEMLIRASTEPMLTFENIQKYKGIMAPEESKFSLLQEDGSVLESSAYWGHIPTNDWSDIEFLASSTQFTAGLKKDGTVITNGLWNADEKIKEWKDIKAISAANLNIIGLKNDGTVVAAGQNRWDVSEWRSIIAITSGDSHYVGIKTDGTVVAKGNNLAAYAGTENWKNIVEVAAGQEYTAGLKEDGTVIATGYFAKEVSNWTNIVTLSSGSNHLVGLRSDGTIVGAGMNSNGQIDFIGWNDMVSVYARGNFTTGLKSDGSIVAVGDIVGGQKNIGDWTGISAISGEGKNIMGLREDGTVIAQGANETRQNETEYWNHVVQISAGKYHNLGLRSDGTVLSTEDLHMLNSWTDMKQVSAGQGFSLGLKTDGTVVSADSSSSRQLNIIFWNDIDKISAGNNFILGLKKDGTMIGGGELTKNWRDIKEFEEGNGFIIALNKEGIVLAFGNNEKSQINVTAWKDIQAISAGENHSVGLKQDGTVLATGSNDYGQLNVENWKGIIAITAGIDYTAGLKEDGTVVITNMTGKAAADITTVNKSVVKPGDKLRFSLSNSKFYTIQSNEYTLHSSVLVDGNLNSLDGEIFEDSYLVKESDIGRVKISFPGTVDLFGNPLQKKDLFQVVPLQSLTSSKTEVRSGDKVTLTASFYQPVEPDFLLSLTGAVEADPVLMKEVAGSGGKKFIFQYTLPTDYEEGFVQANLQNITLADGSRFDMYTEEKIFSKSNLSAPVSSLSVSQTHVKAGDIITIKAKFTEKVTNGIKLSLEGGADLQNAVMEEVPGTNGQEFTYEYYMYGGYSGSVTAYLTNVFDSGGALYKKYKMENLFETDAIWPEVVSLETSHTKAKLGDILTFTTTFSEPVKPEVKIMLSGGTGSKTLDMFEIPGSNGMEFSSKYKVDENDNGNIYAEVIDIEDQAGNQNYYWNGNFFFADGKNPALVSIKTDESNHYLGDYVHIIAEFSETVKSGLKIKLSGAIQNEEYEMSEVLGSQGRKFELYYEVKPDQYRFVDIELSNIEDITGNTIAVSKRKLFYISDPTNAKLKDLTLGGIEFSPSFSPDITEYEATVLFSKDPIAVQLSAEDPDAIVSAEELITIVPGANVYTATVTAKDGTRKDYHVALMATDKGMPILTGVVDATIKAGSIFDTMGGITAADEVDGDLTSAIEITGSLNTETPGQYKLSYSVADKSGNTATSERIVTVIDNQKPIIKGAVNKSIFLNSAFDPKAGITAEDNVDGNLTASLKVSGSVNVKVAGVYTLTYNVTDSSGNIESIPIKITVTLPAPTNLKGTSASYNSAKVSWGSVSGAIGYEVFRSTSSSGTYSSIGTTTVPSFLNSGLTTNKVYYYKVKAYQTNGSTKVSGNYSSAVSAIPLPAAPESVKAASASYSSVKASWAVVSGATGYEVYRATSSGGAYTSIGATTATSLTNSGLTTNAAYYYKVKAYRIVDGKKVYGPFSAIVSTKPALAAITSVKAVSAGYSKNKVSWAQITGATGYEVYRATSKTGSYSRVKTLTAGSSLSYENTGLSTGKTYYYKVRAYRVVAGKNVYGSYSGIVNATPNLAAPSKITAAKASTTAIKTTWAKVGEASGYEVYRATSKAGTYSKAKTITSGSIISFTNTSLNKEKTYYYKVRAYRVVSGKKIYSPYTAIVSNSI